jgi:hypothetical protein
MATVLVLAFGQPAAAATDWTGTKVVVVTTSVKGAPNNCYYKISLSGFAPSSYYLAAEDLTSDENGIIRSPSFRLYTSPRGSVSVTLPGPAGRSLDLRIFPYIIGGDFDERSAWDEADVRPLLRGDRYSFRCG